MFARLALTCRTLPQTSATLAMSEIKDSLSAVFNNLSDETYERSLSFYRLWFTYSTLIQKSPPTRPPMTSGITEAP